MSKDTRGDCLNVKLDSVIDVPACHIENMHWKGAYICLGKNHKYYKIVLELYKKEQQIDKDKVNLRSEVKSVVYSISTIKQLISKWPEIEKHAPDSFKRLKYASVTSTALVPNIQRLNNILEAKDHLLKVVGND